MPVPRRRHCSARTKRGRTHKKLTAVAGMVECKVCNALRIPHHVCPECGDYNGRQIGKDNRPAANS
ncbi:MAG: 50S ribosomal protein L32 [Candidatus Sumerlaeaceae bacterium]|nr:50S ribosomal protein L32 [Candidatus Sumerlaeaceae bacterium]